MDPTKPAIAIGFEGTISEGFLGSSLLGTASIDGAMDALQELNRKFRLVICTSSPPSRFEEISDWITRHRGHRYFTFEITDKRPPAAYYIEKRGIKFENWKQVMSLLGG